MATSISTGQITGRILLAVYAPKEANHIRLVPLGGAALFTPVDPVFAMGDGADVAAVIAQPVRGAINARGAISDGITEGVSLPVGEGGSKWRVRFVAQLADDLTVTIPDVIVNVTTESLNISRTISGASTLTVGGVKAESVEAVDGVLRVTLPGGSTREIPDPSFTVADGDEPVTPTPLPSTVARRFVVLGDSHSDYKPPFDTGTWWWRVAADQAGLIEVDNFAIRGWDTRMALQGDGANPAQIGQAEKSPADLALLMFGGNDVMNNITPDQFKTNLKTLAARLQATGKRVVISFPPPLFPQMDGTYGAIYRQMRAAAQVAASESGSYYTDAWDVMVTSTGAADPAWDSGDTVHLNDLGQYVMGRAMIEDLQKFAGVKDPFGGEARPLDWTQDAQHSTSADGRVVVESIYADDALFHSDRVARVTGGSGDAAVYVDTAARPGERVRVEYPYRVTATTVTSGQYGPGDLWYSWPGPVFSRNMGTPRVKVEGVRRYEHIVPADATSGFVVGVGYMDALPGGAEALVGAARVSVINDAGQLVRLVELPKPAYQPAATNGTGGALTDAKNVTWANSTVSSIYHRKAAHLTGSGPFPLVVHLHGDGYEEVTNYGNNVSTSVAYKYEKAAVDAGALFVMPRTPDTTNQTWYAKDSSTTWLVAFLKMIKAQYNVDARRIFISGYSGGAEEITYNLLADYHTLFQGGGAMILGGGGAEGLTGFTGVPSTQVKEDFLMRWWYGETDNGKAPSDTSIDAVTASAEGSAWYAQRGFNTGRTIIPGVNHYTSETLGPDKLTALIQESNQRYSIG